MKSVFNVSPPAFTKNEIAEIARKHYKVKGDIDELFSDRDQNFIVKDSCNSSIIKVYNQMENESIIDLQEKVINHILDTEPSIKVPKQIGPTITLQKNGHSYLIRHLEYLEGNFLSEIKLSNEDHLKMGMFLGRLSKCLNGFDHPAAHREFDWDARQVGLMKNKLKFIESPKDRNMISDFIDEFERYITPLIGQMRMSVIHNDGNDNNILSDNNNETIGIIDFGDIVNSYTAMESAVCLAYVAIREIDPLPKMISVLKGYQSIFPLSKAELGSMIYLVCMRVCTTLLMATWRKNLFPHNKYLTISEKPAWKFLRKMHQEDLNEWKNKIISNVR
tara:strand:+ start:156 stop:1154 length:999 start_codon:yes stop_codon:yes gene_type:complete